MNSKKRILVTPLNWGLGHATRSIVIVNELLLQGAEPIIGTDGEALVFLRNHFPSLKFIEMPSYNVNYKYSNMYVNMALQLRSILKTLKQERIFTQQIVEKYKIQGIISDHRYSVSHAAIPSVFIGHQLNIIIPNQVVSKAVNYLNRKLISKFDHVWVPDFDLTDNLSGKLSRGFKHSNIKFIGPLSRLNTHVNSIDDYKIVALLSGPEPQRTYFENIIIPQLIEINIPSLLIRGLVKSKKSEESYANLHIKNFADANEISSLIKGTELFISRSGYSTIMDLAKISAPAMLLVPTPGQTEQEYLARRLHDNNVAMVQSQRKIDIKNAWENRRKLKRLIFEDPKSVLSETVIEFLEKIK